MRFLEKFIDVEFTTLNNKHYAMWFPPLPYLLTFNPSYRVLDLVCLYMISKLIFSFG